MEVSKHNVSIKEISRLAVLSSHVTLFRSSFTDDMNFFSLRFSIAGIKVVLFSENFSNKKRNKFIKNLEADSVKVELG